MHKGSSSPEDQIIYLLENHYKDGIPARLLEDLETGPETVLSVLVPEELTQAEQAFVEAVITKGFELSLEQSEIVVGVNATIKGSCVVCHGVNYNQEGPAGSVIHTSSVKDLLTDRSKKKELWEQIKKVRSSGVC